jgi:lipoate-protein ligase A
VGAVLASRFVTPDVEELYDYNVVRSLLAPTMFVVRLAEPTLVLGSSQSIEILDHDKLGSLAVRRRRGGGGLVLLQPDDLWVDWWIPVADKRWSSDVRESSLRVGAWWRDVLATHVRGEVTLHEGALEGALAHRVVCFAGRGPGEVFVDDRKAVGLAQWRVREGSFLTSVLHASPSGAVVDLLASKPAGLLEALDHHVTSSLAIEDPEGLLVELRDVGGPWLERQLFLTT